MKRALARKISTFIYTTTSNVLQTKTRFKSRTVQCRNVEITQGSHNDKTIFILQNTIQELAQLQDALVRDKLLFHEIYTKFYIENNIYEIKSTKKQQHFRLFTR